MEFIKTAYCVTIPLLVLLTWVGRLAWKQYSSNLLAVSNVLLIGHSFFLARQIIAAWQLMQSFSINHSHLLPEEHGLMIRVVLIILLPLLSLHRYFRKSRLFSVLLVALLYSVFPFSSWNNYDLLFKIPGYLCLLCAGYALLWLLNKLPYQSAVD